MEYILAHSVECALGLMALILLSGIISVSVRAKRVEKQLAETETRLLQRMEDFGAAFASEKARMERELKDSYDATNRVVAELVRSQQTRLDAFSGQMASWQPGTPAKPDARIDELIDEVRRASDEMRSRENSMQALATRDELGAYFNDLSEDVRKTLATRDELGAYFNDLSADVRRTLATRDELGAYFNDLSEDVRRTLAIRDELGAYFADLSDDVRRIAEEIRALPAAETQDSGDAELQKIFDRAQNDFALFNEALAKTKKRLRQANESMEDAARCSKQFQKKITRAAGGNK